MQKARFKLLKYTSTEAKKRVDVLNKKNHIEIRGGINHFFCFIPLSLVAKHEIW